MRAVRLANPKSITITILVMWTVQDPRVEGWLPWHYQSGPPGYGSGSPPHENGDYYGAASSPKVLDYLKQIGASLPKP